MSPSNPSPAPDLSELLDGWSRGDATALNDLVAVIYPELRRMARQQLRHQPSDHTLESAALANEAYLKLMRTARIRFKDRVHFLAFCSQVIRTILVDHARRQKCAKRGPDVVRVSLEEALLGTRARGVDLEALDDALTALSKIDQRKGRIVELRYFAGLTVEECAEMLHVSPETVMRDWKMAKLWLLRELTKTSPRPGTTRRPPA